MKRNLFLSRILTIFFTAALFTATLVAEEASLTEIEIPYPDMTGLEEAVKEQLNAAHTDLRALKKRASTSGEVDLQDLAAAYGRLAQLLHAYELGDSATAAYANARQLEPGEFRWTYLLGVLAQDAGRLDEAAEVYRAALELKPDDATARIHLGQVLLAANQPAAAAEELQRVLALAPRNPAVHATLGELALSSKDYEKAAEHLSTALELVPAATRLHYPLAMALRGLGRTDEARSHLAQSGSVGIKAEDPLVAEIETLATGERVHLLRGRRAFGAGQYAAAVEAFREAVQADPRSSRAFVNLGSALGQMGDVSAALQAFNKALEIAPDNFTAHLNLGLIYAHQDWNEEAETHLRAAIDQRYDDAEAHLSLARVLVKQGKGEASVKHFREAVAMQPMVASHYLAHASQLLDLGQLSEAIKVLEEGVRLMPHEVPLAHALTRILVRAPDKGVRNPDRGVRLAQGLFAADPKADYALLVAQALSQLDRCAEAAEWQQALVAAAEEAGQDTAGMRRDLERYVAGPPCQGEN